MFTTAIVRPRVSVGGRASIIRAPLSEAERASLAAQAEPCRLAERQSSSTQIRPRETSIVNGWAVFLALAASVRKIVATFIHGTPLAVDPEWRRLTRAEVDRRRRHAPVRDIQAAKTARLHDLLRGAR